MKKEGARKKERGEQRTRQRNEIKICITVKLRRSKK